MAAVAIRRAREAPSFCSDLSRRGLWNDWTLDCWANSAGSIAVAGSMACAYFSETHSIHASAKPSASRRPLARKYLSYAGHSMGSICLVASPALRWKMSSERTRRCSGGLADTSAIGGRVRGSGRRQLPIFCPRSLEPICAKSAGMPTCADDALPRSPSGFSSGDGSECGIRHCESWLARGRG